MGVPMRRAGSFLVVLSVGVVVAAGLAVGSPRLTTAQARQPACRAAAAPPRTIAAGSGTALVSISSLRPGRAFRATVTGLWLGPSVALRQQTEHWYFQDVYLDTSAADSSRWPVLVGGREFTRAAHDALTVQPATLTGTVPPSGTVDVRVVNANATDGDPTAHGALIEICVL